LELKLAQWEVVVPFHDRGSLWGRWDLHFHTPTSFDYKNGSVTNDQIIEGLKKAGVSAVAITDHHVIDVPPIRALQKLAGNDLTVLASRSGGIFRLTSPCIGLPNRRQSAK